MNRMFRFFTRLSVLLCLVSFLNVKPADHDNFAMDLVGEWLLDSVRVKEIMSDKVVEMMVLPDGRAKFDDAWMMRFMLDGEGKASYLEKCFGNTEEGDYVIKEAPFMVESMDGNTANLIIDGVPDYKILKIQLLSENRLLINHTFSTGYELQDIEVYWTMYYHKSNRSGSN